MGRLISLTEKERELLNMALDDLVEKGRNHRRITGDDEIMIDAYELAEKLKRSFMGLV